MSAVGDISNNFEKLKSELRSIKYPQTVEQAGAFEGYPFVFLPILHHVLLNYSEAFAAHIVEKGFELSGKSDARFVESIYKLLVQMFNYKPQLTKEQFFMNGFAERKIILCTEIVGLVKSKCLKIDKGSSGMNQKSREMV